jgi:hypothetical protein
MRARCTASELQDIFKTGTVHIKLPNNILYLITDIGPPSLHCAMATEEAGVSLNFPVYFSVAQTCVGRTLLLKEEVGPLFLNRTVLLPFFNCSII